jgi:uncharacterized membrane protein YciS (DUF1049 family)
VSEPVQSFESHAKIVPGYHRWTTALLVLPTLYFMYLAIMDFSVERLALFLFCVGVIFAALFARVFPLGVQDRVIRLEERLRMEQLLTPDMRKRIPEFTVEQLVGLRFASDAELSELCKRVLDEGISDRNDIKRAVKSWRADHQRI